jgi:hypothetical protein
MFALGGASIFVSANDAGVDELNRDLALGRAGLLDRGAGDGRLVLDGQLDFETDGAARLVIEGAMDAGHAAARRLREQREPALKVHAAAIAFRSARMSGTKHFLQLAEHRDALLVLSIRSDRDHNPDTDPDKPSTTAVWS